MKYTKIHTATPVPFINENGEFIPLPDDVLTEKITPDFYTHYRLHFECMDKSTLKMYHTILKSQYEAWNTRDTIAHQLLTTLMMPFVTLLTGFTFGRLTPSSTFIDFFWFGIGFLVLTYFLYRLIENFSGSGKEISAKKEKGVFFINLVDDILKEKMDKPIESKESEDKPSN